MLFKGLVLCTFLLICPLDKHIVCLGLWLLSFHTAPSVYLQTVLSVRTFAPPPFHLGSLSHVAVTVSVFYFLFFSIKREGTRSFAQVS